MPLQTDAIKFATEITKAAVTSGGGGAAAHTLEGERVAKFFEAIARKIDELITKG